MRIRPALLAMICGIAACTAAAATAHAGPVDPRTPMALHLDQVGTFSSPVYVTGAPGDTSRLFVVEQGGVIRLVKDGVVAATPFLDLSAKVRFSGEQGLFSMAFAPDYATTGLFYVYYTDTAGNQRVVEFRRANADQADPGSIRPVLVMKDTESNHNGGQLQFGPDGLLYIATGDGGGGNDQHGKRGNAQNLHTLLGKLLRIDPRGTRPRQFTVPASNPFVGVPRALAPIYAYGLRNPWRFSFDRTTGDLIIGDVGQGQVEEVDFAANGTGRGANYGWRVWEGNLLNFPGETAPGAVAPVLTHTHSEGWCAITGGFVARDPALTLVSGDYVYGDFCQGVLRAARLGTGSATNDRSLGLPRVSSLASFGQDAAGRLYAVSLNGPVYRLAQR